MPICGNFTNIINNYYNWLKPPKIKRSECVTKLLEEIYPTINWSNVHFHDGLPWFILPSQADAITLPGTYDFNQIHIYFDDYDECSCHGLSTIVHESYHALQYKDIGTLGIGFVRLFMMQYFACWLKHGYDDHPMEIPAYEHDKNFKKCCNALLDKKICDCKSDPPSFDPTALEDLINNCPEIIKKTSNHSYNCGVVPAIVGTIINLLLGSLIPALEGILFVIGLLITVFVALGCGLIWLWDQLLAFLGIACNWSIQVQQQCVQWAQNTIQACAQWADQGSNQCSQWADQGSNQCSQWADQGSNQCSQWADQGYNRCCDWAPCSWFCKVLVWISKWVCLGWVWVANMVCQAWYWVANMVCQAWYWVANLVCILWVSVVQLSCLAFTWIIRIISCW